MVLSAKHSPCTAGNTQRQCSRPAAGTQSRVGWREACGAGSGTELGCGCVVALPAAGAETPHPLGPDKQPR